MENESEMHKCEGSFNKKEKSLPAAGGFRV